MNPLLSLIFLWPSSRIPSGFLPCQGQLLPISEYEALFTLLGTTYGGDGITTFALPDLRSRIPLGSGTGPGLSNKVLGSASGSESVTLLTNNMPAHQHPAGSINVTSGAVSATMPAPLSTTSSLPVTASTGSSRTPGPGLSFAKTPDISGFGEEDLIYDSSSGASIPLSVNIPGGQQVTFSGTTFALGGNTDNAGGSMPHENRQQYLAVNYLIAINGIFPSQP